MFEQRSVVPTPDEFPMNFESVNVSFRSFLEANFPEA